MKEEIISRVISYSEEVGHWAKISKQGQMHLGGRMALFLTQFSPTSVSFKEKSFLKILYLVKVILAVVVHLVLYRFQRKASDSCSNARY